MPAYFEQGFSVREPMWHGLGEVLPEYPGREEAMRLAGHDFTLVEQPVFVLNDGMSIPTEMPEYKAIVRGDTGKVFQIAKSSYHVLQPEIIWDVADNVVNLPNVKYETAGVLQEGATLWVLAWLDEPTTIKNDISPIYPFVCVSTTNDGSGACKARATSIRVVCWNTFSAAEAQGKKTGREFTFRHTKNVMARIEDAKAALRGVRENHSAFVELANELAGLPVSDIGVEFFVQQFIPKPEAAIISDRVLDNINGARKQVRNLLASDTIGQDKGFYTAYDLLQVGGEYLDHVRGFRNSDTYMGRTLLRQEPLKAKLLPLVREAATV